MKNNRLHYGLFIVGLCLIAVAVATTSCKKKSKEEDKAKIRGCMDATSMTYNPSAEEDDGTCVVPQVKQRAIFLNFTATW